MDTRSSYLMRQFQQRLAKRYLHWTVIFDDWDGEVACGKPNVDPEDTAAVFVTCPACLVEMKKQNPHAFWQGPYPAIAPLKNPLNFPEGEKEGKQ